MSDVVIRAEGLGKKYLIGHQSERRAGATFRDMLADTTRGLLRSAKDIATGRQLLAGDEVEEFWALKDINFEIKRGEVVGIIGRNGAGKSTLLKVLSRITEPTEGRVEIKGRVASLLEVGTGFHPELTGRENIYLNGAILGMSRAEIRRKFDEIVDFSGVEKFLDTPVKRYSSGMYVRLAFAVAAHLEPEILIVDEVLAVGDAEFQKKSLGKMHDVAGDGRTVLFVSHNMAAIQSLCRHGILLAGGSALFSGAAADVINNYIRGDDEPNLELPKVSRRKGTGVVRFTGIKVLDQSQTGQPLSLSLHFDRELPTQRVRMSVLFSSTLDVPIMLLSSELSRKAPSFSHCREAIVRVRKLPLTPGPYRVTLFLELDGLASDWIDDGMTLTVQEGDFYGQGRLMPNGWNAQMALTEQDWLAPTATTANPVPS